MPIVIMNLSQLSRAARVLLCAVCFGWLCGSRSVAAEQRSMKLDDLFLIRRVADPQISPDGQWVAYTVTEVDKADNTTQSDIWLVPLAGGEPRRLAASPKQDRHPRWSPDSRWVVF